MLPAQAPTVAHKQCGHCAEQRPASEFQGNTRSTAGIFTHCRFCAYFQGRLRSCTIETLLAELQPFAPAPATSQVLTACTLDSPQVSRGAN